MGMEHPKVLARLNEHGGLVSRWQLIADGVTPEAVEHAARSMRALYSAVYLSGHAQPTPRQRLLGATLTSPGTVLDAESAAWYYGLEARLPGPVSIVRPGDGGRRGLPSRFPGLGDESDPRFGLTLRRSNLLEPEDWVVNEGIPMLTPARAVVDRLAMLYSERRRARLIRDALRLEVVSPIELHRAIARYRGRRGNGRLRELVDRYALIEADRARSDAEVLALEIIVAAGLPRPRLNVLAEGEEGDLVFVAERHILELDSAGYHAFPSEDERKQRIWEAAGWTVGRAPTDSVYDDHETLLAAATPPRLRR